MYAVRTLIVIFALLISNCAIALEKEAAFPSFSFNGYGMVGLVHSSESNADFTRNIGQAEGAGYSQSWSPDVDSRLGAQLNARFNPELSAVLQVTSEQRHDGTYRPQVEWANIQYAFTPNFSMRVGRVVFPGFLVADYRKVGYAMPWARPPVELYSLAPLTSTDGVDFRYTSQFGELRNAFQLTLGQGSVKTSDGMKVTAKDAWGISDTLEFGATTLRASYMRGTQDFEKTGQLWSLFEGFREFGSEGVEIAEKYEMDGKPLSIFTVGASYDPGTWFAMTEWGVIDHRGVFRKKAGWYLSGGYRWGKFTPYMVYAQANAKSNTSDPGLDSSAFDPAYAGVISDLNAGLNQILINAPKQKTISVGLRWDATKKTAIKIQYDYTDVGEGSYGTLDNRQPGYETGGHFSVFSVVVDFLF